MRLKRYIARLLENSQKGSPKVVQDELFLAFSEKVAEDRKPRRELTLAEHDKIEHPDGFDPKTDTCKFREKLKEKDSVDLIYATSDIHHTGIEDIDDKECGTIVLAGDFMEKAKHKEDIPDAEKWWDERFIPWCEDHKDQQIVIIGGNCDKWLYYNRDKVEWPKNVHYLDDTETEVNGMKVYGTSWCPHNMNGAWEVDNEKLEEEFSKIPEGLDILITHVPPKGKGMELDKDTSFNDHFGSEALTKAILEKKPKLVLCGHIHTGSHKPIKIGDSVVMNVSRIDKDRYEKAFHGRKIGVERAEGGLGFLVDMEDDGKVSLGKKKDVPKSVIKLRDELRELAKKVNRHVDSPSFSGEPDEESVRNVYKAIKDAEEDLAKFNSPKKKMLEDGIASFKKSVESGFTEKMGRIGKLYDGDRNGILNPATFSTSHWWDTKWTPFGNGYSGTDYISGYPSYGQHHYGNQYGGSGLQSWPKTTVQPYKGTSKPYVSSWNGGMSVDDILANYEKKASGSDGKPIDSKKGAKHEEGKADGGKKESEKTAKDELYEALVEDEGLPEGQTLEEHDRQRHRGHFDPSTQSCKFREEMAKETKEDAVDELDSKKGKGEVEREESKTKASLVSPEEDKAYLEAVEKGDMETASNMVRDVAARAFKNTKILDKDGKPLVVYHNGDEKITVPIVPWEGPIEWSGLPGMFFASTELKQYGDVGGKYFINIERPMDMNEGKANYLHGRSGERIDEFADQYEDGIEKGEGEFDFSEDGSLHITDKGLSGLANDGYFGEHPDKDGERVVEYAILTPQQVKSADAVTYDDKGNVIPLSKRFDGGEDVRGDVGNGKKSSDEGSKQSPKEEYDAVVERTEDIKSATENTGAFSSEDKDIRNSRRVDGQGGIEAWDDESRADAEAAGRVLSNLLGGVSFELSDKPHEERDGGDNRKSISGIYTGSAADYEKPSLVHVGTGEGSQVYGWGLYGSTKRLVAEVYARQGRNQNVAAGDAEYKLDGKSLDRKNDVIDSALTYLASERMNTQKAIEEVNRAIDGFKKQLEDTNERLEWDKNNFRLQMDAESLPIRISHLNEVKGFLERDGEKIRQVFPAENIYEQTFFTNREPGDESHLLNWYDPVSEEQLYWINEELARRDIDGRYLNKRADYSFEINGEKEDKTKNGIVLSSGLPPTGSEVYYKLSNLLGSEKAASEFFASAGIDGVKYPVDSYGGKGVKDGNEAGWNYVSFRDDNIRVDHKWVDGEQRFFKNQSGKVVGEYDRRTGKITLYPGAKIKDVVHEFSHGLWQFAEQEAKAGRTDLQEKLHKIAKSAPDAVKESVGRNYVNENPNVILEECFTHEMARRSEQNKAFARAIGTARGKKWYQRAWGAIKDTYKGFSRKIGLDKADTSKLDKMGAHEAAEWILGQMAKGKRFGDITNRDNYKVKDESGGSSQSISANIASEEVTDAIEKRMIGIRDADAIGGARKYFGGRFHSSTGGIRNVRYDSDENAMLINKVVASIMPDLTKRYPKLKDLASGIELLGGVSVEFNANGKKGKSVGFFLAGEGQDVKGGGLALRVVPEYKKEDYAKGTPSVVACTAENSIIYQRANLMHELGHAMLLRTARDRALNPSIGPSWKSVVDGDTSGRLKKVSIYGNSNYNELHSECVSLYTMPGYRKGTLPEEVEKFIKSELV